MDKREQALLEFCQKYDETVTEFDIVKLDNQWLEPTYGTPIGQFAIMNGDEADKAYAEQQKKDFENDGLAIFGNQELKQKVYTECITVSDKDKFIEEMMKLPSALMNIANQEEQKYPVMLEGVNLDEVEGSGHNFAEKLSYGADRYIESMIDKGILKIDLDKAIQETLDCDGRNSIFVNHLRNDNFKDEFEQSVEGETFYIYFQEHEKIDKVVDLAEIILNNYDGFENVTSDDIIEMLEEGKITRETLENEDAQEILENIEQKDEMNFDLE